MVRHQFSAAFQFSQKQCIPNARMQPLDGQILARKSAMRIKATDHAYAAKWRFVPLSCLLCVVRRRFGPSLQYWIPGDRNGIAALP
jgi:hypothetical protein